MNNGSCNIGYFDLDLAQGDCVGMGLTVGDIVKYGYSKYEDESPVIGKVLYINHEGGTIKVLDKYGKIDWFVTSYCEVIK